MYKIFKCTLLSALNLAIKQRQEQERIDEYLMDSSILATWKELRDQLEQGETEIRIHHD